MTARDELSGSTSVLFTAPFGNVEVDSREYDGSVNMFRASCDKSAAVFSKAKVN